MRRLGRWCAAPRKLEDSKILARLRLDAQVLATRFHLPHHEIGPESPRVKKRYGACTADGKISLRLRHARSGELLKYSGLLNTLCHELAHLRHFHHGQQFRTLYLEIIEYARGKGIYRPGPGSTPQWRQLELFPGRFAIPSPSSHRASRPESSRRA